MRLVRTVKVSAKGQVAIPAEIRKALRISEGTSLVLVTDGKRLLVEKEDATGRRVEEDFAPFLRAAEEVMKEVWDNPEDAVWDDA